MLYSDYFSISIIVVIILALVAVCFAVKKLIKRSKKRANNICKMILASSVSSYTGYGYYLNNQPISALDQEKLVFLVQLYNNNSAYLNSQIPDIDTKIKKLQKLSKSTDLKYKDLNDSDYSVIQDAIYDVLFEHKNINMDRLLNKERFINYENNY